VADAAHVVTEAKECVVYVSSSGPNDDRPPGT
jgi:hypothetical protein